MTLEDRLVAAAELWAEARDRSLARLSTMVVNDGNFFVRLARPSATTTTATLEKFARFLIEPENWPDAGVPQEITDFAHIIGVRRREAEPSPDREADAIGSDLSSTAALVEDGAGSPSAACPPAAREGSPIGGEAAE